MAERPAVSTRPIADKLLFKPGLRGAVVNAPAGYVERLGREVGHQLDGTFDFIQWFATRRDELLRDGPRVREAMAPGGLLWVSYPKGKAVPTDLNRDVVRTTLAEISLEVVSQVAIDEVWSALRARRL
jgi:hypothetical protein